MIGETVDVGALRFRVLEHPKYSEAHGGEELGGVAICDQCAIAERLDTGERVLLWLVGGINWSISRHDPNHRRHHDDANAVGL